MNERGSRLKQRMKLRGLTAKEVSDQCVWSIDTIRKLGKIALKQETLDNIEIAIEQASKKKIQLQSAG